MTETPIAADGSNPYQSPSSPEPPDEARLRLMPVIVGWLVDFGGSMLLSVVLGMLLAFQELSHNPRVTPAEFTKLAANPPMWFWITGMGLGLLCTVAGGYVTAWLARYSVWKHVFVMSLLSIGAGILSVLANAAFGATPAWWHFAGSLSAIPAAFLGGWIRVATRRGNT